MQRMHKYAHYAAQNSEQKEREIEIEERKTVAAQVADDVDWKRN